MDPEDTTNPVAVEDNSQETLANTQEVESQGHEAELDENGNPIEGAEEEELELDEDLKLKVPKDQAQRIRDGWLRQSDYTKKTQELAESRKSFETQRQEVLQATNQELEAFANVRNLQGQLAQYQRVDWATWHDKDPFAAQRAHLQYQQVRDALQGAQGQLSHARSTRLSMEQQETAKRLEEGRAVLAKEIGWNDELKAKLTDHALQRGLSRDDVADIEANPAAAKILSDAYQWQQHQAKTKAAQRHENAQKAQPAATVSARRAAPPTGLDDRLSADEWVRRRNQQLQKRS